MKIIIAPDSFKDSLSAVEVCAVIEKAIHAQDASIITESIPVADGGEGTVETLVTATNGTMQNSMVTGPLGEPVNAQWGILGDGKTAIIEMAAASGLMLVPVEQRNPLKTTTFGTGELVRNAIARGCKRIIMGIGGSATTDLGTGMAQALGVKFFDSKDKEITEKMNGHLMGRVSRVDNSGLELDTYHIHISAACDVTNPLLGENGAVYVYSPQKGASPEVCDELEGNMKHLANILQAHKDVRNIPGAGAAGGLGGGLVAFLDAELKSGVELVLNECRFEERIQDADYIISGEGRIDDQIVFGKTIAGICNVAGKYNVPVIAVAGSVTASQKSLEETGLSGCFSICNGPMSLEAAIQNAGDLIYKITRNITGLLIKRDKL